MKKNTILTYLAVTLAVLIPVPGRLAYGIYIIIGINLLMLTAVAANKLIDLINLNTLKVVSIIFLMVCVSIIIRQIIILASPVCAMTLGLTIYFPIAAVFMLGDCFSCSNAPLKDSIKINMKETLYFSIYALLFFIVREIAGYGTLSFPVPNGLAKILFPQFMKVNPNIFWATIPGGIVLAALFLGFVTLIRNKFIIISRSDELKNVGADKC